MLSTTSIGFTLVDFVYRNSTLLYIEIDIRARILYWVCCVTQLDAHAMSFNLRGNVNGHKNTFNTQER